MSNLSDLLPAGASAKSITATDSGSGITSGKPVILETAGTVTQVVETSDAVGTPVVYEAAATDYTAATFDSSSNKVVIAYQDEGNSNYGTAIVGTVSGTSISYGTAVVFESASTEYISTTFDSDSNKVVVAYRDSANSDYGTAIVGTVSGTSISFGTAVVYNSGTTDWISATFDSDSNKVVIAYRDIGAGSPFPGTAIVGTVSGTAISFGTEVGFNAATTAYISTTFDSNSNKVVIAYEDKGNSDYGTAIVGTVSGTSISFGSEAVFESAETEYTSATFDSIKNKVVIAYQDDANSDYGTVVVGTVSGTAISFVTPVVFEASLTQYTSAVFDSDSNKVVIAYEDTGNSGYGTGVVFSVGGSNMTTSNFLGIADEAISASASGSIVVQGGTSAKLTSLTIGSNYYVQADGTFATSAGTPSVKAGLAISATSLLLSGDS